MPTRSHTSNNSHGTPRERILYTRECFQLMADFLILIRSGSTDFDLQGRICGTLDIPLSEVGIAEAHALAARLNAGATALAIPMARPAAIYSSTAACAQETSQIIGRAIGLSPRRITDFQNLDQGLWQGMLVEDIRRKQPRVYRQWQENPWAVVPPEGELLEHACSRVEAILEKLWKRHAGESIALVVPEPLDRIVRWLTAGESMGDLWSRDAQREPLVELPLASQWNQPEPQRAGSERPEKRWAHRHTPTG